MRSAVRLFAVAGSVIAASVITANPVFATTPVLVDNGDGTFTASFDSTVDYLFVCTPDVPASNCNLGNFRWYSNFSGAFGEGNIMAVGLLEADLVNVAIGPNNWPGTPSVYLSDVRLSPVPPSHWAHPADIVQHIGKPDLASCESGLDTPELNWSGAESGGWSESWAQWPNDGAGGPVCVRTLSYSASDGAWHVR